MATLLNKWYRQAYPFFNICILSFSIKKLHYNRAGLQFFNAHCKRVTSSLQKRKHHKKNVIFAKKESALLHQGQN